MSREGSRQSCEDLRERQRLPENGSLTICANFSKLVEIGKLPKKYKFEKETKNNERAHEYEELYGAGH